MATSEPSVAGESSVFQGMRMPRFGVSAVAWSSMANPMLNTSRPVTVLNMLASTTA